MLYAFLINMEYFKAALGYKGVMLADIAFLQNKLPAPYSPFGNPVGKRFPLLLIKRQVVIKVGEEFVYGHGLFYLSEYTNYIRWLSHNEVIAPIID